jgi:hypothetical protein
MGKTQKAMAAKLATTGKTAGAELNDTQLDQAVGGIIAVLKPVALLPAV